MGLEARRGLWCSVGAASQGWVLPTPLPLCLDRWRAVLRGGITVSCAAESQVCRLVSCQWVCPSRRAAPGPQCVTGAHLRGPQATWWACGKQVPSGALAFSLCQASCRHCFINLLPPGPPPIPHFHFVPVPRPQSRILLLQEAILDSLHGKEFLPQAPSLYYFRMSTPSSAP